MKKIFIILLCSFLFAGCKMEGPIIIEPPVIVETHTPPVVEPPVVEPPIIEPPIIDNPITPPPSIDEEIPYNSTIHYPYNETFAVEPATIGYTYYVDGTNGDDVNDGKSPNYLGNGKGAFKTIGRALYRYTSNPPNRVLIKAGKYYTKFWLPSTWKNKFNENNRFRLGPYGNGEVIIDGSITNKISNWEKYSISIYKCIVSDGLKVGSIIIDDDFKTFHPVKSLVELRNKGDWLQEGNTLYLYIEFDPSTRDLIVTQNDGDSSARYGIYIEDLDYVTLYGLTLRGSPAIGIYNGGSFLRIEKCKIAFHARAGLANGSASGLEVIRNKIYGNIMRNYPRGNNGYAVAGGLWAVGIQIPGNSIVRGNIVHENGGEGISILNSTGSIIEDNLSYDNFSVNIYADRTVNTIIRRNFVYCSGTNEKDVYPYVLTYQFDNMRKRLRAEGIATGDEGSTLQPVSTDNKISSNIIKYCRSGLSHYAQSPSSGLKNTTISNNRIYLPLTDPLLEGTKFYGMKYGANDNNTTVNNNIVIGGHKNTILIDWRTSGGITWNDNTYWHPNNSKPFIYKGTKYNFIEWKNITNEDINSKFEEVE